MMPLLMNSFKKNKTLETKKQLEQERELKAQFTYKK